MDPCGRRKATSFTSCALLRQLRYANRIMPIAARIIGDTRIVQLRIAMSAAIVTSSLNATTP